MSKKVAQHHINALFKEVKKVMYSDVALADRYIDQIRKLAMSQRIHLDKPIKRSFCKHCYAAFVPGKTLRVRTQGNKVVYTCLRCKKYTRIPLNK